MKRTRRVDLAIGIVLGLVIGVAIVAVFVFVFSEQAVDAPQLDEDDRPPVEREDER